MGKWDLKLPAGTLKMKVISHSSLPLCLVILDAMFSLQQENSGCVTVGILWNTS